MRKRIPPDVMDKVCRDVLASAQGRPRGTLSTILERVGQQHGYELTNTSVCNAIRRRGLPHISTVMTADRPVTGRKHEVPPPPKEPFEVHDPGDPIDVQELLAERKLKFARKRDYEENRKLIPVDIKLDGPIGILHFGDPHVDDDGTDVEALERHTDLVRETEGLFAANVGDTTNNWVGRLARLYGEQSTSAAEAWALAEWFMGRCQWLYVIAGNHDLWSGAGDPIQWMARKVDSLRQPSEARLNLRFPNGREVRVNARHDFAGTSQWNPAHGPMKAAQMGTHDHIMVCGHKHKSGYGVIKDPANGVISHAIQVASFKVYDRYAMERGFRDQHISPACLTVIDPDAADEVGLVQVFWDAELGAEFLRWLRAKRAA